MDAVRLSAAQGRAVDKLPQSLKRAGHPKGCISGAVFLLVTFLCAAHKEK